MFIYSPIFEHTRHSLKIGDAQSTKFKNHGAQSNKSKMITGILLWDLSAAFDTLDPALMCDKLRIYGFDIIAVNWFCSFLTGRSQCIKIGSSLSKSAPLSSGVPQGGILSPLLYIIYVADLELWLKYSLAITYADDTSSSITAKQMAILIKQLEEDGQNVLNFMASNGLVANPKKTALIFLNSKQNGQEHIEIKIGGVKIQQQTNAKLLGMNFDDKLKWKTHISDKGGVVSSLNKRFYLISRLKNHLNKKSLVRIAESIFTSKLRYGLQLMGKIRWSDSDPKNQELMSIQRVQNRMTRLLNSVKISDKVNTKTLLANINGLSVNQLNAQIKLTEMWKSSAIEHYPIKFNKKIPEDSMGSRSKTNGIINECFGSEKLKSTFINDGIKAWNLAPESIKGCKNLISAKKEIRVFVSSLPV